MALSLPQTVRDLLARMQPGTYRLVHVRGASINGPRGAGYPFSEASDMLFMLPKGWRIEPVKS